jgi:ATPase subunit of ABC transporter with duplicated ATPase domains
MLAKEEAFIARFKARASHAAQVQSRVKKIEKIEKVAAPKRRETLAFEFRPAPRSGEDVLRLAGVDKAWGDRAVFRGLDLLDPAPRALVRDGRERRGQVDAAQARRGRHAAGRGSVTLGSAVVLGYFAQHSMELLDGDETVWETLEQRSRTRRSARCARWPPRSASRATTPPSAVACSRRREGRAGDGAHALRPPNFLVLDEPTNHLDLATKEMLIRALADYEGTLLLVSHDRRFLSALTNRVLELEADGRASTRAAMPST